MGFIKIIWLLASTTVVACKQETRLKADNELKKSIEKKIISQQSSVDLTKLTDFEWDSLLILTPYLNYKQIEDQFAINLSQIKHSNIESRDDISQVIFFKDRKPVRMVEYPRYPGDFSANKVEFIERDSAVFDIVLTREKTLGGKNRINLIKQ